MRTSNKVYPVTALSIASLVPLSNNPFDLYDDQRLEDLVKEVEMMLSAGTDKLPATFRPVGEKLNSTNVTGREYGLSGRNVTRYLRIHRLIPEHKRRLNSGAISIRAAVSLSYLSVEEQQLVDEVLTSTRYKLSMDEAERLRNADKPLSRDVIYNIIEDKSARTAAPFKLDQSIVSRYFGPEQSRDEIESIIIKALGMYFGR